MSLMLTLTILFDSKLWSFQLPSYRHRTNILLNIAIISSFSLSIRLSQASLFRQIFLSVRKVMYYFSYKYLIISALVSDYQVVVYNVFIERGNVGVLTCSIPAPVRDWVEVLGWWRVKDKKGAREEIHSGGRYLVTSAGQTCLLLTNGPNCQC